MAINLDEVMSKLADDAMFQLDENTSMKGSELKAYLNETRGEIAKRDQTLGQYDAEIKRLRQYEADTSTLFKTAAELAAAEGQNPPLDPRLRQQQQSTDDEEEYTALTRDPLYAPVIKKVLPRALKEYGAEIENRFKPQFDNMTKQNQMLTNALLQMQTEANYRNAGEWPEGWDLNKVIETGRQQRLFVPGGEQYGLVDVKRVHDAVMTPIQRQQEIEKIRAEAKEEALREFRMGANVIQMPNREIGGAKRVIAKGTKPEDIIANSLNEAGQDLATQRLLQGIKG